jgi:cyclopropane fatty-acyl-phospholipid synthase-like methyltransferase
MPQLINEEEIVQYYEHCQIDYQIVWHLQSKMCMHYGYWDETTNNLRAALSNMNSKVAAFADIIAGSKVLDAGCGVGGSSIFLAKNFDCSTIGITLSSKQVATCQKNAARHDVSHQCSFDKQNYLHTQFPHNSFDVVWAIESVCYAYDKIDFLNEAYRLLKPGGKLIVADFFGDDCKERSADRALLEKMANMWSIKKFAGVNEFSNKMDFAGFINGRQQDVTGNITRSIKRLYYSFFPGIVINHVAQTLGFRNRVQAANTWSAYYQYKAYKKDLWRYMFFYAEKPTN